MINHVKAIFARHGIPETVISDNRSTTVFLRGIRQIFRRLGIHAHYQQTKIPPKQRKSRTYGADNTKNLLTKSDDPYEALLAYRATLLENGFSPAELCMGRRLRTTLPTTPSKLTPQWPVLTKLREKEAKI